MKCRRILPSETLRLVQIDILSLFPGIASAALGQSSLAGRSQTIDLELHSGERLLDAQHITIGPGAQQDLLFTVAEAPDGVWELRSTTAAGRG